MSSINRIVPTPNPISPVESDAVNIGGNWRKQRDRFTEMRFGLRSTHRKRPTVDFWTIFWKFIDPNYTRLSLVQKIVDWHCFSLSLYHTDDKSVESDIARVWGTVNFRNNHNLCVTLSKREESTSGLASLLIGLIGRLSTSAKGLLEYHARDTEVDDGRRW